MADQSPAPWMAGGCQCGAVRYQLTEPPSDGNVCHCRMCQKAGGAPFMAFAGTKLANLVFTRGKPTIFAYNDGDGSTAYDVEYPIQIHGFDPNFHFVGMT